RLGFGWLLAPFHGRFLPRLAARVKSRTGEHRHQPVARRLVAVALFEMRDMADQASENRAMDGIVSGVAFIEFERAQIIESVVQLRINILPLAHSQVGKKALLAELPPLALR